MIKLYIQIKITAYNWKYYYLTILLSIWNIFSADKNKNLIK